MRRCHKVLYSAIKPLALMALALAISSCANSPQQNADQPSVKTFTVSLANTHVIDAYGKRFMIDSGKHGDELELIAAMKSAGIDPESIDYLIITHGHTDHAGGASYFKEHFGTTIIAGQADQPMMAAGKNGALCSTTLLASLLKPSIEHESYPPVSADIWVNQEFNLATLGAKGRVLSVPSHTPGSVAVIIDDKAFVGDLVRGEMLNKTKPTRHFYMCGLADNDQDIAKMLDNSVIKIWYTGHMGPVSTPSVKEAFE